MKYKNKLYEIERVLKNINRKYMKPIDNQKTGNYIKIIHYYATYSYPYVSDSETTFDTFKLPGNITYEDFFKVISYYSDIADEVVGMPCSLESANYLNGILPLLGCTKVTKKVSNVFPLYLCSGSIRRDDSFPKYYEWYTKDVSLGESRAICEKYSINFYNLLDVSPDKAKIKRSKKITSE